MTLVLFDLDNTLIGGDSDYLWGEFLVSRELVDTEQYRRRNQQFYDDYENGSLDVAEYLRFALSALSELDGTLLERSHAEFMRQSIDPIRLTKADALIKKHKDQGHEIAVITSTNRFVVEPIVRELGIENLICSEPEIVDGRYTGDFVGTPCFAEGKITKINQWLEENSGKLSGAGPDVLKSAWFYSDSHNDLPLMREVGVPIAVDPDSKLRAEAQDRIWKIISLR